MAELGALEAMAELGAQETMAVQGAQEAMAVLGAQEAMAGAGSSGGHGRCRELRRPWQVVFHGRGLVPRPGHFSRNPSTPPQKKIPGEVRGYQEPSGAGHTEQYMTGQERPSGARQTGQDSPQEQEALLG